MSDKDSSNDFYEAILREHTKLRGLLGDIRQLLFERDGAMSQVSTLLVDLQQTLEAHFRLEEDSGCFGDLVNHAPRVAGKVKALIIEHADFCAAANELVACASNCQGGDSGWDEVSARFGDFSARLMNHETIENELLQEVFTEDIGSND